MSTVRINFMKAGLMHIAEYVTTLSSCSTVVFVQGTRKTRSCFSFCSHVLADIILQLLCKAEFDIFLIILNPHPLSFVAKINRQ